MSKITFMNAREIGERLAHDLPRRSPELALAMLVHGLCESAHADPLALVVLLVIVCRKIESMARRHDLLQRALGDSPTIVRELAN